MNFWSRIKKLQAKQLWKLIEVFGKNPRYVFPSIRATRRTLNICDKQYGKAHHKNNQANAFRHALWNFLLCQNIFNVGNDLEKAIQWTKEVTDLHEEIFFSRELDRAMDLHNNMVGRMLFEKERTNSLPENEIISILKEMAKNAEQIRLPEDVKKYFGELVFVE